MANWLASKIIASALTDLLNTPISTMKVFDEMFLIEMGSSGKDKVFNKYVSKMMLDHMTPKNESTKKKLKKSLEMA